MTSRRDYRLASAAGDRDTEVAGHVTEQWADGDDDEFVELIAILLEARDVNASIVVCQMVDDVDSVGQVVVAFSSRSKDSGQEDYFGNWLVDRKVVCGSGHEVASFDVHTFFVVECGQNVYEKWIKVCPKNVTVDTRTLSEMVHLPWTASC